MATVFQSRPVTYKVGMLLLVTGLAMYVTGFSSPYWTVIDVQITHDYVTGNSGFTDHSGLWRACTTVLNALVKLCSSTSQLSPGWLHSVQVLQCTALVCLLAACVYAIVVNFVQRHPRYTRVLETTSALGGFLGFVGAMIYVFKVHQMALKTTSFPADLENWNIGLNRAAWAFILDVAGCIVVIIASLIITFSNLPFETENPPANVSIVSPPPTPVVYRVAGRSPVLSANKIVEFSHMLDSSASVEACYTVGGVPKSQIEVTEGPEECGQVTGMRASLEPCYIITAGDVTLPPPYQFLENETTGNDVLLSPMAANKKPSSCADQQIVAECHPPPYEADQLEENTGDEETSVQNE